MLKNISLKISTKLTIGIAILVILTITQSLITARDVRKSAKIEKQKQVYINAGIITDKLLINMLTARKNEKDFMMRHKGGKGADKYINGLKKNVADMQNQLEEISPIFKSNKNIQKELKTLNQALEEYQTKFLQIVNKYVEIGFKNDGTIGEFREATHQVESYLKEKSRNRTLMIILLNIRRAEKDYLLRLDDKYVDKIAGLIESFKEFTSINKLHNLIDVYHEKFQTIVDLKKEIGYTSKDGLTGEMRSIIHKVTPSTKNIQKLVKKEIDTYSAMQKKQIKATDQRRITLTILLIIIMVILGVIIVRMIKKNQSNY